MRRGLPGPHIALLGWCAFLVTIVAVGVTSWTSASLAVGLLVGINVTTFALYGYDKWSSRRETFRVPENLLHLAALAGGSPAAFAGQQVFRHKTRKRSFRIAFWAIVILQAAALAVYLFVG